MVCLLAFARPWFVCEGTLSANTSVTTPVQPLYSQLTSWDSLRIMVLSVIVVAAADAEEVVLAVVQVLIRVVIVIVTVIVVVAVVVCLSTLV